MQQNDVGQGQINALTAPVWWWGGAKTKFDIRCSSFFLLDALRSFCAPAFDSRTDAEPSKKRD